MQNEHKGLRFNEGKLRYDLVNPHAHEQMVNILTLGSLKYAERNWELGMKWSNVISSLKRHLAAIERGEDFDLETGQLHAAHLTCNAHFLTAYYKIYPQGDDRPHRYLKMPKIGLDIDEVIADWLGHYCKAHNLSIPESWAFDRKLPEKFLTLREDKDFWLSIPPKIKPSDIPFEPVVYVTARTLPTEWAEEWLDKHGFPAGTVHSVPANTSKVEIIKSLGIEMFIDDNFKNFTELNNAGICCFLYDNLHNKRYDVGYKRITSFQDFKNRFL